MTNVSMSTQAKGLLLLVMLVAYASGARGYTTFITNQSSRAITASTSYLGGSSQFVNRIIAPGTHHSDQYAEPFDQNVHIEIWVEGAGLHNHVDVLFDRSIVGNDNGDRSGVDIYLAKFGTLVDKDGGVLVTIFDNSLVE